MVLSNGWVNCFDFERALASVSSPHDSPSTHIFFPEKCSLLIAPALRILSLANQLVLSNREVTLEFAAGEVGTMGYLNRIGFFDHLLSGVEVLPFRPFRSGARTFRGGNTGVVEIARIDPGYRESSRNIHNTLAAALEGAYRGDEDRNVLWGATWTIFSELIDNIYSHSATPLDGYAALQVYPGAKKATVTVSDSGYGIMHTLRGSLKTKFPHLVDLSDSQLLLEIFQHGGVSRHGPQNGLGLHGSAQKAMKFHADLDVRLPNSRVHLKPNVQGYNKLAYWSDGLPLLWGTHISFDFRLDATH